MATSSPDLTPVEFWLWGYFKSRVNRNSTSLVELKDAFRPEFSYIQPEMLHAVVNGVITRLETISCGDGGPIEQHHTSSATSWLLVKEGRNTHSDLEWCLGAVLFELASFGSEMHAFDQGCPTFSDLATLLVTCVKT
ncbi:uncharacterized protein TNCV_1253181 [Trichonephila clavipes]|nr:uncharacterized protein TNCV_1253181 [Trichonephila clavipes]